MREVWWGVIALRGPSKRTVELGLALIGFVVLLSGCQASEAAKQENRKLWWEAVEARSDPSNPPLAQEDIAEILRRSDAASHEDVTGSAQYGDNMAMIETDSGKMGGHHIIAERMDSGWEIRATFVWMF